MNRLKSRLRRKTMVTAISIEYHYINIVQQQPDDSLSYTNGKWQSFIQDAYYTDSTFQTLDSTAASGGKGGLALQSTLPSNNSWMLARIPPSRWLLWTHTASIHHNMVVHQQCMRELTNVQIITWFFSVMHDRSTSGIEIPKDYRIAVAYSLLCSWLQSPCFLQSDCIRRYRALCRALRRYIPLELRALRRP